MPAILPPGTTLNPNNPGNTLVGQLVSAKLNVRYDEIDPDFAPYEGLLKDLVITGGTFVGWTFQELIDEADMTIGGCASAYTCATLSSALTTINNGYDAPGEDVGIFTCPSTAGMILQDGPTTSVTLMEPMDVLVYPVPVREQATIRISDLQEGGEITVDVLNLLGVSERVLFNGSVEAGEVKSITWDVTGLAPGAYVCRVVMGDRVTTRRVIVQ
jgi:hypothetical protein